MHDPQDGGTLLTFAVTYFDPSAEADTPDESCGGVGGFGLDGFGAAPLSGYVPM